MANIFYHSFVISGGGRYCFRRKLVLSRPKSIVLNAAEYSQLRQDGCWWLGYIWPHVISDGHDDVGMQVSMAGGFSLKCILMVKTDSSIWKNQTTNKLLTTRMCPCLYKPLLDPVIFALLLRLSIQFKTMYLIFYKKHSKLRQCGIMWTLDKITSVHHNALHRLARVCFISIHCAFHDRQTFPFERFTSALRFHQTTHPTNKHMMILIMTHLHGNNDVPYLTILI